MPSTSFLLLVGSATAQTISEARMQAELLNGGVNKYSTANCMHQGGGGTCMVSDTAKGFRFRFLGGAPGWVANRRPATLETEVLNFPDGRSLRVEYNGPIRTKSKS